MKKLLSLLILASLVFACDPDSLNELGDELSEQIRSTTNFSVRLTDAPVELEEVNIDLRQIMVKGPNGFSEIPLETNAGIYNLLDYQNGLDVLIAEAELEIDQIREIRLILGDDNTVVADGETYDLKVPSGSQSGLKIKLCLDLTDTPNYELILDFDAAESVHKTGNGKYIMKPVIRPLNADAQCGDDEEEEDDDDDLTVDDLPEDAALWLQQNYDGYDFTVATTTLCGGTEAFQVKATQDEEEIYLFFDQDGAYLQSKVEIEESELPEVITMTLSSDYADYMPANNKKIYRIETADGSIQYQLTLRKANELLELILADETGEEVCSESSIDDDEEEDEDEEEEEEGITIDDVPEDIINFLGENYAGYTFAVEAQTFCEGTETYLLTGQNGSNTVLLYYDLEWNLWQTGTWFKETDLSTEILGSVAADYPDYKIMNNQAWELVKADESQSWYRIYIKKDKSSEKRYVVYAADGTFICEEE